ncbi:MAG: efflux RND transporter permease subunit [Pseudomonadota bacterium]
MLTALANANARIVFAVVAVMMALGLIAYNTLPALEDPKITIREAVVSVSYPGLTPERIERLVTKPIERAVRQVAAVDEVESSSLPGLSIVRATAASNVTALDQVWDELRDQVEAARAALPAGAGEPIIQDEVGDVAVLTAALIAPGYALGEIEDMAAHLRDRLYAVEGVKRIDLLGVVPERIEVRLDEARLAQKGLSAERVTAAIAARNIIRPGGTIDMGALSLVIEPTGDLAALSALRETLIPTAGGQMLPLRDIATIHRVPMTSPPERAYVDGERAVVLAVTMLDGTRVLNFAPRLKAALAELEAGLPVGASVKLVTDQAEQVQTAVFGVTANVFQTILLVCGVVILLLGVRSGLIVGAIVPTVMLATVALFGLFGVSLERMSLATLVIALGLFVDNGIVVAEDFRRRLGEGASRDDALKGVGKELAFPLLASTATTILVFLPLMLAPHESGEYTRSISIVVALSLSISWLMAMTLTPILCHRFLKAPDPHARRPINERAFDPIKASYRAVLKTALKRRILFLIGTIAALALGVFGMATAPQKFFPDSDRAQILAYIDLPAGVTTDRTDAVMQDVMAAIDGAAFDWMESFVAYVGTGGPRFVLSLTPVDPAPNRAFMVLNVSDVGTMDRAIGELRALIDGEFPDVRSAIAKMFLGPADSNVIEVEVSGPDPDVLLNTAADIEALLARVPEAYDISHDWENRVPRLVIAVDQNRARDAGVTSAAIASALSRTVSGEMVTEFREGDDTIPIIARGEVDLRTDPSRLETLPIPTEGGRTVPLSQVATIEVVGGFSRIERQDLARAVTVEGKSFAMAAEDIAAIIRADLDVLGAALPPGHQVRITGVVQDSAEGSSSLAANFPLCLALIGILLIAQFNSFRKALVVLLTMPLVICGVALGVHVMQANFGFMPILGILALFGIILNNAIVLIDRIDLERAAGTDDLEAIVEACVRRLRPILMTVITTVLGLMPLILSRDPLFYGFASVVAFGLAVGTVLTLGVVPILYAVFMRVRSPTMAERNAPVAEPAPAE